MTSGANSFHQVAQEILCCEDLLADGPARLRTRLWESLRSVKAGDADAELLASLASKAAYMNGREAALPEVKLWLHVVNADQDMKVLPDEQQCYAHGIRALLAAGCADLSPVRALFATVPKDADTETIFSLEFIKVPETCGCGRGHLWRHPEQPLIWLEETEPALDAHFTASLHDAWTAAGGGAGMCAFWRVRHLDGRAQSHPIGGRSASAAAARGIWHLARGMTPEENVVVMGEVSAQGRLQPVLGLKQKITSVLRSPELPFATCAVVSGEAEFEHLLKELPEDLREAARRQVLRVDPALDAVVLVEAWHVRAIRELRSWKADATDLLGPLDKAAFVTPGLLRCNAEGRTVSSHGESDELRAVEYEGREEAGYPFVSPWPWVHAVETPGARLVLLGGPGSGKTFVTRHLLRDPGQEFRVWVAAKDVLACLRGAPGSCWAVLWKVVNCTRGQVPEAFMHTDPKLPHWPPRPSMVIVDALDEVAGDLAAPDLFRRWLAELAAGQASVIVTSRALDWRQGRSSALVPSSVAWEHVLLQNLSPAGQRHFIQRQNLKPITRLQVEEWLAQPMLRHCGRAPAMLVMLGELAQDTRLPAGLNNSGLMRAMLERVLNGWYTAEKPARPIDLEFLSGVVLRLFDQGGESTENLFLESAWRRELRQAQQDASADWDVLTYLKKARLLMPVGLSASLEPQVAFVHRSLLEFLVAWGLRRDDSRLAALLAPERLERMPMLHQPRWQPVVEFVFAALEKKDAEDQMLKWVQALPDDLFYRREWWLLHLLPYVAHIGEAPTNVVKKWVEGWFQLGRQASWRAELWRQSLPDDVPNSQLAALIASVVARQAVQGVAAARLLGRLNSRAAEQQVLRIFHDATSGDRVRAAAMEALGRVQVRAEAEVMKLAQGETTTSELRIAALSCLGQIGCEDALRCLNHVMWHSPNEVYATIAATALLRHQEAGCFEEPAAQALRQGLRRGLLVCRTMRLRRLMPELIDWLRNFRVCSEDFYLGLCAVEVLGLTPLQREGLREMLVAVAGARPDDDDHDKMLEKERVPFCAQVAARLLEPAPRLRLDTPVPRESPWTDLLHKWGDPNEQLMERWSAALDELANAPGSPAQDLPEYIDLLVTWAGRMTDAAEPQPARALRDRLMELLTSTSELPIMRSCLRGLTAVSALLNELIPPSATITSNTR